MGQHEIHQESVVGEQQLMPTIEANKNAQKPAEESISEWLKNLKQSILRSKNSRVYCKKQLEQLQEIPEGKRVKTALAFLAMNRNQERSREILEHIKSRLDGQTSLKAANQTAYHLGNAAHGEEGNIFYVQFNEYVGCWYSLEWE